IVMVLPLLAAYFLFAWVNSFNDERKVEEHIQLTSELEQIKNTLDHPELYSPYADHDEVEKLSNQKQSIVLYNQDGIVLYSSNPAFSSRLGIGREQLYNDLYDINQGYRSYSYKQPVFDDNELIGFFQVEVLREEWVTGVNTRGYFVAGLFLIIFTLTYLTVVWLVNKKLNLRLTGLMEDMSAFASGKSFKERQTNQDEIGKLTKHFYNMKHQIESSREVIEQEQQAKEYLIASVSHDLKTPLTSIKAYAESLESRELTEGQQNEYQQVIVEKSDFMQQMLDDLLTYTLLQSPSQAIEFVEVEGSEFFDMLVSDYEPICKKKEIQLHTNVDVDGKYSVNPKQMMRVADNLMSNAIQHTPSGGRIWIAALSREQMPPEWLFEFMKEENMIFQDDSVYLIVQNEGKGIPENKLAYVFDPIYQADEARNKQNRHGTGLGLSITKQMIEKHHGEIEIFSKESIGTCVICKLPKFMEVVKNENKNTDF